MKQTVSINCDLSSPPPSFIYACPAYALPVGCVTYDALWREPSHNCFVLFCFVLFCCLYLCGGGMLCVTVHIGQRACPCIHGNNVCWVNHFRCIITFSTTAVSTTAVFHKLCTSSILSCCTNETCMCHYTWMSWVTSWMSWVTITN